MYKYYLYFITRIKKELFYKSNILGLLITSGFMLVVQVQLWHSIYGEQSDIKGIAYSSVFLYLVLGVVHRKFLGSGVEIQISESFRQGNIAIDMSRPQKYHFMVMADDLGRAIIHLVAISIVMILFFIFFHSNIEMVSRGNIFKFLASSLISYFIFFEMSFCIGILSIWMGTSIGLSMIKGSLFSLLGGTLIPVDFYPAWLRLLVNVLPFKYIYYTPLSFFLRDISTEELVKSFSIQLGWLLLFTVACAILYRKSKKRLVIQGG